MKRTVILAVLLALVCFQAEAQTVKSYDKVIPKPQEIKAAAGTYHHRASDVINVKYNRKLPEEGYLLKVTPDRVTIEASGSAGVFYARQTLAQMSGGIFSDVESSEWTVDCCTIKDSPRFPYRGLHMDVSRHFRSKEFVLRHIDAMAAVKLNRLHMHLTDSEGWRLQIDSYPLLTEVAAWRTVQFRNDWRMTDRKFSNAQDGFGGFYTKDDIREIVAYAAERHITVVPEIDIPGHSTEVCAVYPELGCSGEPYRSSVLCPGKEETFVFIEKVLEEVMELFPSEYIHIGGDEVNKRQWAECPDCRRRMEEEGLKDVDELQSWTIKRVEKFIESRGRHIIGWDEILDGGVAPNATIMSWRGTEGGIRATGLGHDAIMTPQKFCYIDAAQDKPDKEPAAYGVYLPLWKMYEYNPTDEMPDPSHIIGVQANLWSEYVVSDEYAEYMYWPRGLAVSEVGWTRPENKDGYARFHERALDINGQMETAGYHVFDLKSEAGNRPEYYVPVDHLAKGCKVTYNDCQWSGSYPAGKESTFTDGLLGGWSYRDDRWQGFLRDIDVTIDLGSVRTVSYIEAEFYEKGRDMQAPVYAEVQVSADGVNFTTVAEVGEKPVPPTEEEMSQQRARRQQRQPVAVTEKAPYRHVVIPEERGTAVTFKSLSASFNEADARYVRFKACRGSFGGWTFIDEIIVR